MRWHHFAAAAVLGVGVWTIGNVSADPAGPVPTKPAAADVVRIGTYDSRAIAVAYAASTFNPVKQKMAEHEAAKKANDQEKLQALEAWGKSHQRLLHFQGFGRVPVSDLLEPVREGVNGVVADQHLSAITMACDAKADGVEVVDVTDALVALYEPTPRTLEMVKKVRAVDPVSLVDLAKLDERD